MGSSSSEVFTFQWYNGGYVSSVATAAVYRDPSAWYHLVCAYDSTQATAANRVILYVNGVQQSVTSYSGGAATYPSQNTSSFIDTATGHRIGGYSNGYFDGYLTEINFIDGQALTPSSFGEYNSDNIWVPKTFSGTYGNNGFYLPFSDNSALTTASNAGLGKDFSGNANYWVTNNISITSGSTYDSMIDAPTDAASATQPAGNYATINPINYLGIPATAANTVVDGNLNATMVVGTYYNVCASSIALPRSGKYYFEVKYASGGTNGASVGVFSNSYAGTIAGAGCFGVDWNASAQYVMHNGTNSSSADANCPSASGQTIAVAVDMTAGLIWIGSDRASSGTIAWMNSGAPGSGTGALISISGGGGLYADWTLGTSDWYFAFTGAYSGGQVMQANFGQRPFLNTPPTGFSALCTANITAPPDASKWFNGAAPDLLWIKDRTSTYGHAIVDSVRGFEMTLKSNASDAEVSIPDVSDVNKFGMTVIGDTNYRVNKSTDKYVYWAWKGGGTAVTNNDGNRTASVSASTTAGFSVVTYTFSTSATNTIGHGLGVAPSMILMRNRTQAYNWDVYHVSVGYTQRLILNSTSAATSGYWAATPTNTVFSVSASDALDNDNMVAYCFAPIAGYSAFGSYTGNGSADGPFVYCGFIPRWILIKRTDSTANWYLYDTSRAPYNTTNAWLQPNTTSAENSATTWEFDLLSSGFKVRNNGAFSNASSGTYIYAAFAETPFNYSRAR
jgi:hypothetical protein